MTHYMDDKEMLKNWRGRRLVACRALDTIKVLIDNLGIEEDQKILPPADSKAVETNESVKNELKNLTSVLLRLILTHNDGAMSRDQLKTW